MYYLTLQIGLNGACHGDSGSPLFKRDFKNATDPYWVQLGIVHGGVGQECASKAFPNIYARVEHHEILSFIKSKIKKNLCNPNPCGPNSKCLIGNNDTVVCACKDDYDGPPCGLNAECRSQDNVFYCECKIGYYGDPNETCLKGTFN